MPFAYRLRRSGQADPERRDETRTLLAVDLSSAPGAAKALAAAEAIREEAGRDAWLLSERPALGGEAGLGLEPALLDRRRPYDLLLLDGDDGPHALSTAEISVAANLDLASLRRIDVENGVSDYVRPAPPGAKRALFVFPGLFAPPKVGSHQRALSTALDLIDSGYAVDVVVKRADPADFARSEPYLRLLAGAVHGYAGGEARGFLRAKRRAIDAAAWALGLSAPPPSFEEREARDVSASGQALIARLIAQGAYDAVVTSFPWMVALVETGEGTAPKLVCDAHDVVSNRGRALGGALAGLAFPEATTRRREQALLGRCDTVLAISETDKALFERRLNLANVRVHPLSFRATEPTLAWRNLAGPLRFGFIGSGMAANRQALALVLKEWWPAIERFSPDSTLTLAGPVTQARQVAPLFLLRRNVESLGIVDDLGKFYDRIDVLLSPALVQPGVNVKNVEALLAGKIVIANALGAESLLPLALPTVADGADAVIALLRRLERRDADLLDSLDALSQAVRERHGGGRPLAMFGTGEGGAP
ncbi:glycosyltransferase [Hansschlegelia sp. KR7-227]|jgi:hypothetical protein|uniref:glycosyltransferase n=1 Tax=Hansschlegelia sp. KR7-227 TaxID=3400914 RepID=UPI003C05A134